MARLPPTDRTSSGPLRVGTRGSALALWQTEKVRALLADNGVITERIEIRTTGDIVADVPLAQIGSRALFTKQLDDALLEGRIDLAVHSLKDLPTVLPDGIALAATGLRDDPRDALVGRVSLRWADLPRGATVATSSLRRRAQLLRARPDLQVVDLRGNVDTRLAKLDAEPTWGAIIVAAAGLRRLGRIDRIGEALNFDVMLPAPGQGALAVTTRSDDTPSATSVRAALHDHNVHLAVSAERGFLRALEGGCQVPIAAFAETVGKEVVLRGRIIGLDGVAAVDGRLAGPAANAEAAGALGRELARRLAAEGGAELLRAIRLDAPAPTVAEP